MLQPDIPVDKYLPLIWKTVVVTPIHESSADDKVSNYGPTVSTSTPQKNRGTPNAQLDSITFSVKQCINRSAIRVRFLRFCSLLQIVFIYYLQFEALFNLLSYILLTSAKYSTCRTYISILVPN